MKTLYVTDLDGTLLNSKSKLSAQTIEILNRLMAQGLAFTYATARSFSSARLVTAGLKLSLPVITYNGAFFVDPADGEILQTLHFTPEQCTLIRQTFEEHKIYPLVYAIRDGAEKVSWVHGLENDGIQRYLQNRAGDPRLNKLSELAELYTGKLFYFTAIGKREQLEPLAEFFQKSGQFICLFQLELYTTDEYWLEIMPVGATKAQGIKRLQDMTGCDRVVCFGDGLNDRSMFAAADEAYAVRNAHEQLRQAATGVIGSNDEDGVANWLLEHTEFA